jgi:6-phosphogluconate dehydrogenase (decarboxylating)
MTQGDLDRLLRWGIVFSIVWLAGVGSLFALLAGRKAQREIARSGGEMEGSGRARWCVIVGSIGLVIWIPILTIALANQF